jgi:magnesium and cobalt transporter
MLPVEMSEDPPSTPQPRSWFERITQALSGEPQSREELIEELRHAQTNGLLSNDTLSMVEGAIEVAELTVADVMVPRAQMVSLPIDAPLPQVLEIVIESGHSRFPVHAGDKDEILGILLAKDLLRCMQQGSAQDIRPLLRPVTMIPESKRLNILLKEFRLSRSHMAIVVDEYGGVAGLVTIEDVLEQIVGDIDDEHDDDDDEQTLIQSGANGEFLVNALTPIAEFNERFGSDFSDEEFDTVGGMVTSEIGHLPEVGEEAVFGGFHFQITKADARRVLQFSVRVHEA